MTIMGLFKKTMDMKGYLGPFLLFIYTLYLLRNKTKGTSKFIQLA